MIIAEPSVEIVVPRTHHRIAGKKAPRIGNAVSVQISEGVSQGIGLARVGKAPLRAGSSQWPLIGQVVVGTVFSQNHASSRAVSLAADIQKVPIKTQAVLTGIAAAVIVRVQLTIAARPVS